jgi:LmbE family N-acetylglucosaminyl deacetylase
MAAKGVAGPNGERRARLRRVGALLLVLIVFSGASAVQYEAYLARSRTPPEAYPILHLADYHRLLVLAPHCDDEALGAAGLIQAALQDGLEVRVVVVTAGDGYRRATVAHTGRSTVTAADFIAMGELRQQESLEGMAWLGLGEGNVIFLTYPEKGLSALWWEYWEEDHPYHSPYSGLAYNTYARAFHPGAPYSGSVLLQDLRDILRAYRPDLIVAPHPLDEHDDHRALSAFVSLAVEMEQAEEPAFHPQILGYLVHYGLYPQPMGLRPGLSISPPRRLESIGEWVRWDLSAQEMMVKYRAIRAYRSQMRILASYLSAFVRQDELFMWVDSSIPLEYVEGESLLDADRLRVMLGSIASPVRGDPVDDSTVRRLARGADIDGVRLIRLGDSLWVGVELRGRPNPIYGYYLRVRTVTEDGSATRSLRYRRSADDMLEQGRTIWYRLDLEDLENPDWLVLAAETRRGMVLDRTAWYVIRLEAGPFG